MLQNLPTTSFLFSAIQSSINKNRYKRIVTMDAGTTPDDSVKPVSPEFVGSIALLGLGSIGVSFLALYLQFTKASIRVFDPRDDLAQHISSTLSVYLSEPEWKDKNLKQKLASRGFKICNSIEEACADVDIVQEQGPEDLQFKQTTWEKVIHSAPAKAHLWSSTSGITASRQVQNLSDKSRLLVVHPFNPPHIMPLIEIVPSPHTSPDEVNFAQAFFQRLRSNHVPVVIKTELEGFVANRLAFVLFREACHLVSEGVVTPDELDKVVESSVGPRWTTAGPFKSYHYGGGKDGLQGFMNNLAPTVQGIWDDAGTPSLRDTHLQSRDGGDGTPPAEDWAKKVIKLTEDAYGEVTPEALQIRDDRLKAAIASQRQWA